MFNAKELLEKLNLHPITKQIEKEERERVNQERKEAAARRDKLLKELSKVAIEDKETAGIRTELRQSEETVKILKERLAARVADRRSKVFTLEHKAGVEAAFLAETADPGLDLAVKFFRDKFESYRRPGALNSDVAVDNRLNVVNLTYDITRRSNSPAIKAAMDYCRAAIEKLEALKLLPVFDQAAVDDLKAGIPSIEVFTESSRKKLADGAHSSKALAL